MRVALLVASVVAVASAAPAVGQPMAQPAYAHGDFSSFKGDASALPHALSVIEETNGGRVVDIRFRPDSRTPGFDAVVAHDRGVQFIRFRESGGAVVLQQTSEPSWMLPWRKKMDALLVKQAPVSLLKAVRTAEAAYNNEPVIAAGIARSATNPASDVHAYNVLLLGSGGVKRVAVDSSTGEIIANPNALETY